MSRPRVLITRSSQQASELAERLRALGLEPILIPAIEIAEPSSFVALDAALAQLVSPAGRTGFDWLLFTSANAVQAFYPRLTGSGGNRSLAATRSVDQISAAGDELTSGNHALPGELPLTLRIAAIGPSTARALQAVGLRADLIPPTAVAEALAAELLPHARHPDGSPARFLLVRAEAARDYLPDTLRAAGAEVTVAPAYRNIIPASSTAKLQSLFATAEARPDAIIFTSSSSALNLQALLEASSLALPSCILRVSIGPLTSQTLRELKFPPHAEAQEATVAALAEAVARVLELER